MACLAIRGKIFFICSKNCLKPSHPRSPWHCRRLKRLPDGKCIIRYLLNIYVCVYIYITCDVHGSYPIFNVSFMKNNFETMALAVA